MPRPRRREKPRDFHRKEQRTNDGRIYALITPYTPEQNGIIERFFRSLKEECLWQYNFVSFEHARRELTAWIRWYNEARPHQALGYRSPREFRAHEATSVA